MQRQLVTWAVLGSFAAWSAPAPDIAPMAGPSVMVFELAPAQRILMPVFEENMRFLGSLKEGRVRASDTAGVRGIEVAMYYVRSSVWTNRPVAEIPFARADMRARYYPSRGNRPAFFLSARPAALLNGSVMNGGVSRGGYPPIVAPAGLEILSRRGVPTAVSPTRH